MSIWEKVSQSASGLLSAGDALLALLGRDGGDRKPQRDIAFTIGLIALCAKMAKADGEVTRDEVAAFEQVFDVPEAEAENVRRFFDQARGSIAGYESYARRLAGHFRDRPGVLEDVLDALFHIAKADRHVDERELVYLGTVARHFGFSELEYARIKAAHLGAGEADAYLILGLDSAASAEEIRAAYRRLVRENHPDALIARGIPTEFVALATEKLAAINAAYERLTKNRYVGA